MNFYAAETNSDIQLIYKKIYYVVSKYILNVYKMLIISFYVNLIT